MSELTERQRMMAVMVRCGFSNKQIALYAGITPAGVRNTLALVYRRLGIEGKANRRVKLAVMVVEEHRSQNNRDGQD